MLYLADINTQRIKMSKYETFERIKGHTVLDPQEYFTKLQDSLHDLDKSGLYDRQNKIDNQYFSSKENELKEMEKLLYKIVGSMLNDSNADKFRYDVKILVTDKKIK
jgi:hypothetical protein